MKECWQPHSGGRSGGGPSSERRKKSRRLEVMINKKKGEWFSSISRLWRWRPCWLLSHGGRRPGASWWDLLTACPVIDGVKGRRELTLGHLCKVGSCIKPFQAPLLLWWGTGTLAFREPQVLLGITDLGLAEERVCVCVCTCVFLS